jgi:small subunit ribosomal protein S18
LENLSKTMSEETTPTPAISDPAAASNSGGFDKDPAKAMAAATSAILKDKEGDLARPKARRKRKVSYLTINKVYSVDYKDVATLRKFINERGKMISSRQTGNTAKQQRMIAQAIRRAREMALLPFVVTEGVPDRPMRGPRTPRGERHIERTAEENQ